MSNYMIVTEGPHDLATIRRIITVNKWGNVIRNEKDIPSFWKILLSGIKYPFTEDLDNHFAPVPTIFSINDTDSLAVFIANGES